MSPDVIPPANPKPTSVRFNYTKSPMHRVVHCGGVFGGLVPNGDLYAAIFSQHGAIPRSVTHRVGPEGQVLEETARDVVEGIEREVEISLMMDIAQALSFRNWLDEKIKQAAKQGILVTESANGPTMERKIS